MQPEGTGGGEKEGTPDERALAEITKAAEDTRAIHKKFQLVTWILTLAILAVFIIFGLLCYSAVKNNFTEEKLQKSLKQHAREITPDVSTSAATLLTDVGPVYSKLGRIKLREVTPKWIELGEKEISRIGNNLGEVAEEEVHDAVTTAIRKSGLEEALPELTEAQVEVLRHKLEKRITRDLEDISGHVLDRTSAEMIEISNTLDSFDLSGLPDDEDGLSRIIVHDLLMLLDKQIMDPSEEDFLSKLVAHDLFELIRQRNAEEKQ
jgi:hypothetical protein